MNLFTRKVKAKENCYSIKSAIEELILEKDEIISSLGYSNNSIDEHFGKMIDIAIDKFYSLAEIKAGYKIADFEKSGGVKNKILLEGNVFNVGKIVYSQLKKSEKAAIFICTIGDKMEKWAKKELQNDAAFGFIIDTVASAAAEKAADMLHIFISDEMKKDGLNITNRYSPGYCNWSVSEQHKLFSILPANFCGISLNESALMNPIKSVSGIIGVGKEVTWNDYLCDTCLMKECIYRKKRQIELNKKEVTNDR